MKGEYTFTIADNYAAVSRFLQKDTPVVVDIETTSLIPNLGKILCVGLSHVDSAETIVFWPKHLDDIGKLTLRRAVMHNASFDKVWLEYNHAQVDVIWDTMVMAHLLDEEGPQGLKDLGQQLGIRDWSHPHIDSLALCSQEDVSAYVAQDVIVTRELMLHQVRSLKKGLAPGEDPLRVMTQIVLPAIDPIASMEATGLPIDEAKLDAVTAAVGQRRDSIIRDLDAQLPDKSTWPEYLTKGAHSWGSTNLTRWWLYKYKGLPVTAVGKPSKAWPQGVPSLSRETLAKLSDPSAAKLLELAKLNKTLKGFLIPIKKKLHGGRVYTSFRITGTVTGRLSSCSPGKDRPGINSQQIPRDREVRCLFADKQKAWIECDYSQLELRVIAALANDPVMMDLFETGVDIHKYMAQKITGKDEVTKEERSLAKGVNFGFVYGMGAAHFQKYLSSVYSIEVSLEYSEKVRNQFFETFKELPRWYRKQKEFALEYGGVSNVFGRFRHLPKVYSDDFFIRENALRKAINFPVQSTGSDLLLMSLRKVYKNEEFSRLGAELVTTVHDSLEIIAPYKNALKTAALVKELMEEVADKCPIPITLRADAAVSHCWGGDPYATL